MDIFFPLKSAKRRVISGVKMPPMDNHSAGQLRFYAQKITVSLQRLFCTDFKYTWFNRTEINERGLSYERNCVLRRWRSETQKKIINHRVSMVN